MTDERSPPIKQAFLAVPKTKTCVARELRRMAAGIGPYRQFTYTSPWIKNIWSAAADLLENE
jgi:hypothetical protein